MNDLQNLVSSMKKSGWKWTKAPIDVVKMQDGSLITLDNTRVLAAHNVGVKTRAIIRNADDLLPKKYIQLERFATKKDGNPLTWGEAVQFKINKQNKLFQITYPSGSKITGVSNKP